MPEDLGFDSKAMRGREVWPPAAALAFHGHVSPAVSELPAVPIDFTMNSRDHSL